MRSTLLAAALAAAFATCAGTAHAGGPYDITNDNELTGTVTIGANDVIYQAGATKGTGNDSANIDIAGGTLTIGQDGGAGYGFELSAGTVDLNGGDVIVTSAASASAATGKNVSLNVTQLDLATANTLAITGAAADATAAVTVATLNSAAGGTIDIGANGTLTVTGTATATNLNLTFSAAGAQASFANGLTLGEGSIAATAAGESYMAVGTGGLSLDNATPANASIGADGGTLKVLVDLADKTAYGDVTLGTNGATIDIQNNGALYVGKLTVNEGTEFAAAGLGSLYADSLEINNTGAVNRFTDSATVNTVVKGLTTIKTGARYDVAGTGNQYQGGMTLEAGAFLVNVTAGNTTITLGTGANNLAALNLDGGSIISSANTFKIDYADIAITTAGMDVLYATGALDLSTSAVTVNMATATDANSIQADGGITMKSYSQISGNMAVSTTVGKMTVADKAVIGKTGATDAIALTVNGDSVAFEGGARLDEMGAIISGTTAGTVNLGTAAVGADLELAGNATLDGLTNNDLTIVNTAAGTAASRLVAIGSGNQALGEIVATDVDLVVNSTSPAGTPALVVSQGTTNGLDVNSVTVQQGELALGSAAGAGLLTTRGDAVVMAGGTLSANDIASTIAGTAGHTLRVASGGSITANGVDLRATGFNSVTIDGTYTAGYNGGNAIFSSDAGITIGATGIVAMSNDLAMNVVINDVLLHSDVAITNSGASSWTSMFGTFNYVLDNADQDLVVSVITNRVVGDDATSRANAYANLQRMWGNNQIGRDLADIVVDVNITPPRITNPSGSVAGDKNLGIFEAIANPSGKNIDRGTLEYVNGGHLYGVTDVAIETNRSFFTDIANRAKVVNRQFTALRETMGSTDALASTAMNKEAANRVWAGGFGLWQDSDMHDGFSGYKYDSWGVIMGYDRAIGPGLAVGVSGAYNKGDYKDKGALAHDSDIESWSGGLYATYSTCAGFFATVFGGYTYSDNDLRELRRDPVSGTNQWAEADFYTNTWSAGGAMGWDIRPVCNLTITPSVGFNYIRAKNSTHDSWLGGVATQQIRGAKNHGMFLPVELTMQYDVQVGDDAKIRLEAGGGYAYNFEKGGLDGSISYFDLVGPGGSVTAAVRSRDNSRHSYKVGGGVRYQYKNVDVGVRYDYMGKNHYDAHRVMGTLGVSF